MTAAGRSTLLILVTLLAWALPRAAGAAELFPFNMVDQSPLVQIYGLPGPESARVLGDGNYFTRLAVDVANNFTESEARNEAILLDGESWRTTLTVRRGFGETLEAGLMIPFVSQSGGMFDGFIKGWHDVFHLPQGGRDETPNGRLDYLYVKDGTRRLDYTDSHGGLGDISLTAGVQLYRTGGSALALRAALKLPTGDSKRLLGSGSTDLSLWLTGQGDYRAARLGNFALFGSVGGVAKSRGDVLADQELPVVGFGDLGAGWSPWRPVAFKVQLSAHSPFYHGSALPEVGKFSLMLITGGTIAFSERTTFDIGVSEDVLVRRSPDVGLHLSLARSF